MRLLIYFDTNVFDHHFAEDTAVIQMYQAPRVNSI
jgi:hypothetical protein